MRLKPDNIWAVGAGGFLGAIARYGLGKLASGDYAFLITGAINLSGSFVLAFILRLVTLQKTKMSERLRLFLTSGFLGAFTTFSTFSFEILSLWRSGQIWLSLGYALVSLSGGLGAAWLGFQAASKFYPPD